jgi:ribonucleoside-triphosphate reductase
MKNITESLYKDITQHFQEVIYSLNEPAAARGFQSVFWNISIFDEYYFKELF